MTATLAVTREDIAALAHAPDAEERVLAAHCRARFSEFVPVFWPLVPGAGAAPDWNWHLDVFCVEAQAAAERVFRGLPKEHDVALNVPPGTSKSTIWSILFPAWLWTRMPACRVLAASHTEDLALDLANKSRQVIKSELYRALFPYVILREDQDSKGYFANTAGGDRRTCTVAGKSPIGFHAHVVLCDDPLDPKKALSEAELRTAAHFMTEVLPSRKVDKAVSVTFLIMQRLGLGDPTDVVLKSVGAKGAARVRHVCLPAELEKGADGAWDCSFVSPPELAQRYVDGLLDPKRMPRAVLDEFKARGALYFATQFQQRPYARTGGMFREGMFNRRVKAAPYAAKRVRYWDRASTDGAGCRTAGTLLAYADGIWYVEHCVAGQWEPDERNAVMRATALRDRARYGPRYEPRILYEREGGSSGRDAAKGVARALEGFAVFETPVSGSKEVRAEPWQAQLAAGNVCLVDNGESDGTGKPDWDVQGYVDEHLAFPLGDFKDRVDSSSGAFNAMAAGPRGQPALRTFRGGPPGKGKGPRLWVLTAAELAEAVVEERALLVCVRDPATLSGEGVVPHGGRSLPGEPGGPGLPAEVNGAGDVPPPPLFPPHACQALLGSVLLEFADLDPAALQDRWDEPVPPWGLPPAQLMMTRDHGRKLWSLLTKRRDPAAEVFIFSSPGGRRALSLALAAADGLRIPRDMILVAADPDNKVGADRKAPNEHVFQQAKTSRALVL